MAAAPTPPDPSAAMSVLPALIPALGGLGMMMFLVANRNPVFLMAGMVLVLAMICGAIALVVVSRTGARRAFTKARERYLEYLERIRRQVREAGDNHREYSRAAHPEPEELIGLALSRRVYERRPGDGDFGVLRVGTGTIDHPLRLQVPSPPSPLQRIDPVCQRSSAALAAGYRWLTEAPLTVQAEPGASIVLRADSHEDAVNLARCLISQAAVWHSPEDLRIAVCSPSVETDFAFVRWLPHSHDPRALNDVAPRCWLGTSWADLAERLSAQLRDRAAAAAHRRRHGALPRPTDVLLVVLDEWELGPSGPLTLPDLSHPFGELGVCLVRIVRTAHDEPAEVSIRVAHDHEGLSVESLRADTALWGYPDPCPSATADAIARALAPRLAAAELRADRALVDETPLENLLDLPDIRAWTPQKGWADRTRRDFLRVAIGTRSDGQRLEMDLKESAYGGMGPHGLLVGATGSGKSELLRTLVLGLAATHPPEQLAFVLVDFKGGATFAGLDDLPHVAGVITNLEADLGLVDRMHDAMLGEITRRQQILHDHGNLPNVLAYESARRADPSMPPLPHLLFIVDEFAELLTVRPDFNGLFTTIGRIGRSIGVHQLLASQRLDDGRLRGLESFLSYRLALW
nr:type VII secretion protein EccCa [Kineosphaera limosa]